VAYLDESVMPALRIGQPTRVAFNAAGGDAVAGRVLSIGREVDPDTREVELRVGLGSAPERWALGQRVDVRVDTDTGSAATVPTTMVIWQGTAPGLYVANGGRSHWVAVELGRPRGEYVEILRGVSTGDTVLAPTGLQEGLRVLPIVGSAGRAP
jgi:HlyD family secretion protein